MYKIGVPLWISSIVILKLYQQRSLNDWLFLVYIRASRFQYFKCSLNIQFVDKDPFCDSSWVRKFEATAQPAACMLNQFVSLNCTLQDIKQKWNWEVMRKQMNHSPSSKELACMGSKQNSNQILKWKQLLHLKLKRLDLRRNVFPLSQASCPPVKPFF